MTDYRPDRKSGEPNKPLFDEAAFDAMSMAQRVMVLMGTVNHLFNEIGKLQARLASTEVERGNADVPVRRIRTDGIIDVTQKGEEVLLGLDEDELRQNLLSSLSTAITTPFGKCPGFFVYDIQTICGVQPPILFFFLKHTTTCQERAMIRTLCCCDGDSGSGSGSYTHDLDRWGGPCSDAGSGSANDGTNFIYLPAYIFDNLSGTYDDPIIQLDGDGFCYQLIQRGVTGIETTYTSINVMEVCTDSDCEDEPPCISCPGDTNPAGVKISGWADTNFFGTLESDTGGGCTNGGATSANPSWDGRATTYSVSDCEYEVPANQSFTIGGGAKVDVGDVGLGTWVNPGGGAACYWRCRIAFSLNATSSFIEYRKYFGDTRLGTYTKHSTDPASLGTCSVGIPNTITIVAV